MAEIQDIRKCIDRWKQTSYKAGLEYCFAIKNNPTVYNLCVKVLNEQGFVEKYADLKILSEYAF